MSTVREEVHREAVEAVYPDMVRAVPSLRAAGANSHDGTGLFDSVRDTVYSDSCCHYHQLGNDLMRAFLVDRLAEIL